MATPQNSLATLRPDLSESLEQFDLAADRAGFIGMQAAPLIDVPEASGTYGIIPVKELLQNRSDTRSPGSGYNRGKHKFDDANYATKEHGLEEPIDDAESKMYRNYFDQELVSTSRAMDGVLRNAEIRVSDLLFNPATFTGAMTGAAAGVWTDWETSKPLNDVQAAVKGVYANCGLWPTSLIISRLAFIDLRNSEQIIDRLKYNGLTDVKADNITASILAQVFDLKEVLVAGGAQNEANEGQAAEISTIWDPTMCMVARISRSIDFRSPTVARTFHWGADGSTEMGTVETYRDETVRGDVVRVRRQTDERIVYQQLGYLLTGIG